MGVAQERTSDRQADIAMEALKNYERRV